MHCADLSADGMVYVCDRVNNRIQVFSKDGKFVKEVQYAKESLGDGSVWDVAFSKDAQQQYLYLSDGRNSKIRVIDRQSLNELYNFGEGGHYPGQFYSIHSIAIDSQGQPVHDGDLSGPSRAEVRRQGCWCRAAQGNGRCLAGNDQPVG